MSTRLTRTASAVENLFGLRRVSAVLAALREGDHPVPGALPEGVVSRVGQALAQVNALDAAHAVTKGGMLATAGAMAVAGLAVAVRMDPSIVSSALEVAKLSAYATGGGLVGLAASGAHDLEVEHLVVLREAMSSRVTAKSERLRALEADVVQLRSRAPSTEREPSVPEDGHRAGAVTLRAGDSSATLDDASVENDDNLTPGGP